MITPDLSLMLLLAPVGDKFSLGSRDIPGRKAIEFHLLDECLQTFRRCLRTIGHGTELQPEIAQILFTF